MTESVVLDATIEASRIAMVQRCSVLSRNWSIADTSPVDSSRPARAHAGCDRRAECSRRGTAGLVDTPDDGAQIVAPELLGRPKPTGPTSSVVPPVNSRAPPPLRLEIMAARLLVPSAERSDVGALARIEHLERPRVGSTRRRSDSPTQASAQGLRSADGRGCGSDAESVDPRRDHPTTPRKSKPATKASAAPRAEDL